MLHARAGLAVEAVAVAPQHVEQAAVARDRLFERFFRAADARASPRRCNSRITPR